MFCVIILIVLIMSMIILTVQLKVILLVGAGEKRSASVNNCVWGVFSNLIVQVSFDKFVQELAEPALLYFSLCPQSDETFSFPHLQIKYIATWSIRLIDLHLHSLDVSLNCRAPYNYQLPQQTHLAISRSINHKADLLNKLFGNEETSMQKMIKIEPKDVRE